MKTKKNETKVSKQKLQINIAFDDEMIHYLNDVAKNKYFPFINPNDVKFQDVVRAIIRKDMLENHKK